MAYGNWGGFAYRNGVHVPVRSDATVYADGHVSTIWDDSTERPYVEGEPAIGGHVVLGDGSVKAVMYKHYLEVFVDLVSQERLFALDSSIGEYGLQEHRRTIEGHKIVHRIVAFDRDDLCSVVHVQQPDGTHWHGFCGLSIGAGFTNHTEARRTKRAIRAMRRTFKEQWGFWGPC